MAGHSGTSLLITGIPGDVQEKLTKQLLIGAVITNLETTESGATLENITLKLRDGREAHLYEVNEPLWSGSSIGWIGISIDDKDYPFENKK